MRGFKSFLLEYLTDKQRETIHQRFGPQELTPEAKKATDHFFGPNSDEKEIPFELDDDKSETHKRVEEHIGRPLTHDEYIKGLTTDKYGREVRVGRLLSKNKELLDKFSQDPRRSAKDPTKQYTLRVVRGIEVFGQTNPNPNEQHPDGHSWENASCKNIETGLMRSTLPREAKHGTVVAFVKNHKGEEIYRATLQPYIGNAGSRLYRVNGEYGRKYPGFKQHAERVGEELSTPDDKTYEYNIHPDVYNDSGHSTHFNEKVSTEDVIDNKSISVHGKIHALYRASTPTHVVDSIVQRGFDEPHLLSSDYDFTRLHSAALGHSKLSDEMATKAITSQDVNVRVPAIMNCKLQPKHVETFNAEALHDVAQGRAHALDHSTVAAMVNKIASHEDPQRVVPAARFMMESDEITPEHLEKMHDFVAKHANEKDWRSIEGADIAAASSRHITSSLGHKLLNKGDNIDTLRSLVRNDNTPKDVIDRVINERPTTNRELIRTISWSNSVEPEHLKKIISDNERNGSTVAEMCDHFKANNDVFKHALKTIHNNAKHVSGFTYNDQLEDVTRSIVRHGKVSAELVNDIFGDSRIPNSVKGRVFRYAERPIQEKHLIPLVKDEYVDATSRMSMIQSGAISPESLRKLLRDTQTPKHTKYYILNNGKGVTTDDITHLIETEKDPDVLARAINHTSATPEHVMWGLNHEDPDIARAAAESLQHDKHTLKAAALHTSTNVSRGALTNLRFHMIADDPVVHDRFMNHPVSEVRREFAGTHARYVPHEKLKRWVASQDDGHVAKRFIEGIHQNGIEHEMDDVIKHIYEHGTKYAAIGMLHNYMVRPKLSHIEAALKNKDETVREHAQSFLDNGRYRNDN